MNWIIYFFGGRAAFFWGVGITLASVVFFSVFHRKWPKRIATLVAFVGLILIGVSATPLPYWFYGAAGAISLLWLVAERSETDRLRSWRKLLRVFVAVIWSAGALAEIPYTFAPTFNATGRPTLYIFADSVTAGFDDAAMTTWPTSLARSKAIDVQDYSQMGAKVSSMVRKAEGLSLGDGIVLLEIGGNDVLGSTSALEFEWALEHLLKMLTGPGREVVTFELPLPPFSNQFGRIQRRLAEKYRVQLIPKRIFVGVLTANGATVDSVHLSRQGHELMAESIWGIIRQAYEPPR